MKGLLYCKFFGHKWMYRDYIHSMKRDGSKYNYTSVRLCVRCEKKEFKFAKWIDEKLVPRTEFD